MYCTVKALTLLLESYKQRNQGLTVKKEIKTLESRQIYRNRWMSLKEDRILRANGSEGLYSVIEKMISWSSFRLRMMKSIWLNNTDTLWAREPQNSLKEVGNVLATLHLKTLPEASLKKKPG